MSSNKCDNVEERNFIMTTVDSLRQSDTVVFDRDCEGTQIPYGNKITVPKGTQAYVGQTLGGNVTLQVPSLGLVQVMNKDVGALLKDGVALAPIAGTTEEAPKQHDGPADEKEVWEVLKTCYDPEIPV